MAMRGASARRVQAVQQEEDVHAQPGHWASWQVGLSLKCTVLAGAL
jgi:hypothetical protein